MARLLIRRSLGSPPPPPSSSLPDYVTYEPTIDSRVVYVSNEGSDANDGLSTGAPKATLAAGRALMRNGFPDYLLFRRGDTFDITGSAFSGPSNTWGGASNSARSKVGAYGDVSAARPRIRTTGNFWSVGFGLRQHLVFESLDLEQVERTSSGGWGFLLGGDATQNITIQDCRVRNFASGIQGCTAGSSNILLLRNVVADCWGGSDAQGLLLSNIDNLTAVGNIIDRCGYETSAFDTGDSRTRNIYVQSNCDNVVWRDNWSVRSSSNGAQMRAGGIHVRNVYAVNANGLIFGVTRSDSSDPYIGGVTGPCSFNLDIESQDLPSLADGRGMEFGNISADPGVDAQENIVVGTRSAASGTFASAFHLIGTVTAPDSGPPIAQPILGLRMFRPIAWDCDRSIRIAGAMGTDIDGSWIESGVFHTVAASGQASRSVDAPTLNAANLSFSGNRYGSGATNRYRVNGSDIALAAWITASGESDASETMPSYSDPGRRLTDYHAHLGLGVGTNADVFALLREQRMGSWDAALDARACIDYVRAGFDLSPCPVGDSL